MKRIGYVIPRVAEVNNLAEAFYRAAKGKRCHPAVQRFEADLDRELARLSADILDGDVRVGQFHRFVIWDPKTRVIHAAAFRERVLHHAIMNVCGTSFERGAIDHSYACRRGKGNRAALLEALRHTTARPLYLKLDIRKFFDSINHEVLRQRFHRLFKDRDLLALLDRIVCAYHTNPGTGLPIGTLTSQYFANFYLDPFDRFVVSDLGFRCYVRFMDDFILWGDSADALVRARREIGGWLSENLKLDLKVTASVNRCADGAGFLGYRLKPGKILLGRAARRRFRRRLREDGLEYREGRLDENDLQRRFGALVAFTDPADCMRWRRRAVAEACQDFERGTV